MTELDPYTVLGVPRGASREEIARAYRRMAKRFHPDAATGAPHTAMARINEAWRVLSDATRRARWDRAHSVVQPAPWAGPAPEATPRRPSARPASPPESRDSGWLAVTVVAVVAVLTILVMVALNLPNATSAEAQPRVTAGAMSFENLHEWVIADGAEDQPAGHRVLAHIMSFGVDRSLFCTSFADPCQLSADLIPPGEASIVVTAWAGGTPPVPDLIRQRPYGLDAQRIIGDEPAAFRLRRLADSAVAWWQLSPPGFPDRWIEVEATIGGQVLEQDAVMRQIEAMLATVTFTP